jgi:predicted transcriptional regulator
MKSSELKNLVSVINTKKRISTKKLANELELNYPYLTLMMSGKHKPSISYVNRIMDFAEKNNVKTIGYNESELKSVAKEESSSNYLPKEKAMVAGAIFEIITTVRISNDIVTGYNVDLKRIQ